ncbi:hypothetical protein [Paraherbaspirillum soli]|uniref:Uncharacterized protein n=1 Tax=Paraherbaspirillum soli TaxID=631222 RepID=A0ABW0MDY0_9BURK
MVDQFKVKYPNIDVKVFDNNGVMLSRPGGFATPAFNPNKVRGR